MKICEKCIKATREYNESTNFLEFYTEKYDTINKKWVKLSDPLPIQIKCHDCSLAEYEKEKKSGMPLVITKEDRNKMLLEANYSCTLCLRPKEPRKLFIDHCHKTGKIRGVLCPSCNTGIGLFRENTEIMEKAIKYIQTHKQ